MGHMKNPVTATWKKSPLEKKPWRLHEKKLWLEKKLWGLHEKNPGLEKKNYEGYMKKNGEVRKTPTRVKDKFSTIQNVLHVVAQMGYTHGHILKPGLSCTGHAHPVCSDCGLEVEPMAVEWCCCAYGGGVQSWMGMNTQWLVESQVQVILDVLPVCCICQAQCSQLLNAFWGQQIFSGVAYNLDMYTIQNLLMIIECTYMYPVIPSCAIKNALDHSMIKSVQGSLVCMLCCSLECIKTHCTVKCPLFPRVNTKCILTMNDWSKCNFEFLPAVTEGAPENTKLVLRQVYQACKLCWQLIMLLSRVKIGHDSSRWCDFHSEESRVLVCSSDIRRWLTMLLAQVTW